MFRITINRFEVLESKLLELKDERFTVHCVLNPEIRVPQIFDQLGSTVCILYLRR